jgi:PAS domain S-box-containing protein
MYRDTIIVVDRTGGCFRIFSMDKKTKPITESAPQSDREETTTASGSAAPDNPLADSDEHLHRVLKDVAFFKSEIRTYTDQLCRMRGELESYQARYRKLFESSPIAYFSLDEEGTIIEVNGATEQMLRLHRSSLANRSFASFIVRPSYEHIRSTTAQGSPGKARLTVPLVSTEVTFRSTDGREIPALMRIIEIDDTVRDVPLFLAAVVDITDRKAAEDALRESERRYRDHIDNIGDIIYLLDETANLSSVNATLEQIIGRPGDTTYEDFAAVVGERVRRRFDDEARDRGESDDSRFFELTLVDTSGRKRIFEVSEAVVRSGGRIAEIHGIGRDITEQKRYLDTIFESIADGVCSVNRDFIITSFNGAAQRITSVPRALAVGKKCREVFRSSLCEGRCPIENSIETGKPTVVAGTRIVSADGSQVPISLTATALRDEGGEVVGGVITFRDLSLIEDLRREISEKYSSHDIVSRNKKIRGIFDILPDIASSESTVLIEGRSGTGKELFARAIHGLSQRRKGPFVAVNCAALPETLLESELFGYVKGAFTNAVTDKPGRFAAARGGTLFLDEIAEMPPALQVKLLRVLQERKYEPLGSIKTETADVRIVASSNRTLTGEVAAGTFREDLYYRLNIVKIPLPDLAERREDIPLLVEYFVRKISTKTGKQVDGVSEEVMELLMRYDYPGNIRELENIIEHAFVLCRGPVLMVRHLPEEFISAVGPAGGDTDEGLNNLMAAERRIIEEALIRHEGNKSKVAQSLNIGRTTLWRKIRKYGLE